MTLEEMHQQRTLFELDGKRAPRPKARPRGSGLANNGETCGTCKHSGYVEYNRRFYKCGLNRNRWTNGTATDIRLKDAACGFWEKEQAAE